MLESLNINMIIVYNYNIYFAKIKIFTFCEVNDILYLRLVIMKLIKREYLKDLIDVIGTPDIKIITGVRRSGKSKLLEMFKNYIIENIKNYNIIGINFNLVKFDNLRDYISLNIAYQYGSVWNTIKT